VEQSEHYVRQRQGPREIRQAVSDERSAHRDHDPRLSPGTTAGHGRVDERLRANSTIAVSLRRIVQSRAETGGATGEQWRTPAYAGT
jgi:hypothetical protein